MPAIERESGVWRFDDPEPEEPHDGPVLELTEGEADVLRDLLEYIGERINAGTAHASALAQDDFKSLRRKVSNL